VQSRPFGVALLIAGWDGDTGPVLYMTDPSGMFNSCTAMAIGSGSEGAQTTLQEDYKPDLTFKEAEILALSTLKQVMEEKASPSPVLNGGKYCCTF
jgi:20S proteasome subunit alpha 5